MRNAVVSAGGKGGLGGFLGKAILNPFGILFDQGPAISASRPLQLAFHHLLDDNHYGAPRLLQQLQ